MLQYEKEQKRLVARMKIVLTKHAQERIRDRKIEEEWIHQTLESPDAENMVNGLCHLFKKIKVNDDRVLHLVVLRLVSTEVKIISVYFDRTMRRKL